MRTSRRWIKSSNSWMKTSSMARYARASGAGCVGPHHPGEQNIWSPWRILFFFDTEDQPGSREEVVMVLRARAPPSCWPHLEWHIAKSYLGGYDLVGQI